MIMYETKYFTVRTLCTTTEVRWYRRQRIQKGYDTNPSLSTSTLA